MGSEGHAHPLRKSPAARELQAEAWLPVLRDALAQHGRFVFPLRGDSMRPTLPDTCDVEVVPLSGPPRLGQLIVFAAGGSLVAHRFVGRRGGVWIAQGDNRRGPDLPLKAEQVLGRVAAARVDGRRVWPRRGESLRASVWLARYRSLQLARWGLRAMLRR